MQHSWPSRCAALAIVGCLAQASSLAATVGRAPGSVPVGPPLEVSVPVLLAESDPAVDVQQPMASAATPGRIAAVESAVSAANAAPSTTGHDAPVLAAPESPAAQPQPQRSKQANPSMAAAKPTSPAPSRLHPSPLPGAPATGAAREGLKLDVSVGPGEPGAPSEEAIRQAGRLQSVERDLREMRQFLQRSDAAMLRLQERLAKAESERYANPLVYALAALLVAMAGFTAFLWRRVGIAREGVAPDRWRPPGDERPGGRPVAAVNARGAETGSGKAKPVAAAASVPASRVAGEVAAGGAVPPLVRMPLATSRLGDFQTSQGTRALKAEELHDVQQEADFFSSLGEYDRAIEVLRSHIEAHPETSAVAWLDLVEIYYKLGRREEFDWVRREFHRRFNAQVPSFDEYSQESAGIEAYDNAMARITALWPSRRVLDVIEESILRGPGKDGTQAFSLQAYRELLLLHHIGQQVLAGSATPPSAFGDPGPVSSSHGFSQTSIHPLSTRLASLGQQPATQPVDSQPVTQITGAQPDFVLDDELHLELDLNLDEPVGTQHAGPRDEHLLDFDLSDVSCVDGSDAGRSRG